MPGALKVEHLDALHQRVNRMARPTSLCECALPLAWDLTDPNPNHLRGEGMEAMEAILATVAHHQTHHQSRVRHLFSSTWTLRRPTKASIIGQSALGILQCIGNNTHPECAHAIDTCARHCVSPQQAHRNALKKIGHHLKGVLDDGLIIDPKRDLSLDCCVDADFAGNCNAKEIEDPATV